MLFIAVVLFALATSQISCAPTNDEDASSIEGTPCLGKESGAMVPHPTNHHKYLRCVDDLSLWIETCNDNLYFNPDVNLCDWNFKTVSTTTFHTNLAVKSHAVLFKSKLTLEQMEAIRQQKKLKHHKKNKHNKIDAVATTVTTPVDTMTTVDSTIESSTPATTAAAASMMPTLARLAPVAMEPPRIGMRSQSQPSSMTSLMAGRK